VRLLTVVGNRPQFVKSAPLSLAFRAAGLEEVVLHTGQHYDRELSAVFFEELGLDDPEHRLELRSADPDRMLPGIEAAIAAERPDTVVVLGDTNSTVAGARAAAGAGVPVAHVEAGLRSGDLEMPEERNRIEVDRTAAVLFVPDEHAAGTLAREGVPGRIELVGDVMADATARFAPIARRRSAILDLLGLDPGGYAVATVHREANVRPERLRRILDGLGLVDGPVVLPAHPRTRAVVEAERMDVPAAVLLLEPLGYLDFAALASQARVILTDSGGLQKEAYWYGVPCVTLRPSTEWVETVRAGGNVLVDDDPGRIAAAAAGARFPASAPRLYGDGRAAERIARALAAGSVCARRYDVAP
jgi:UDP-N-acetylglucosamine 2-epimerase